MNENPNVITRLYANSVTVKMGKLLKTTSWILAWTKTHDDIHERPGTHIPSSGSKAIMHGKPQDAARGSALKCLRETETKTSFGKLVNSTNAQPDLIFHHLSRPSRKEVICHS